MYICELLLKVWNGNSDGLGTVTNMFRTPLEARFIRIYPLDYKSKMCLRLELYGCKKSKKVQSLLGVLLKDFYR